MSEVQGPAPPAAAIIGGRFVVEGTLGRGGMAAVFRVRDSRSGRVYALKRSWARDARHAAKRRVLLEREFQTLANLRHPRIIEVHDYGVDAEGPYYTMELLDGADLDRSGRLPWQEACALLRDIASSLAIVHSRGLIHRDVSARNVQRTADGRAKLIDFGAMVSIGLAGDVIGTPAFMAPEVLQMQTLDARADLFSLGALGYYLLTGRHAYPARRTSELRDIWRSRPAPPSRFYPEIPAALSTLILQLLSLDRGARPHIAAEVMERLCVIAELPKEELPEIQRGYLATPTLVGRHQTLLAIRNRMLSLMRGDGGALLLEGPPGSGRTRMIDACAFEGKLMSAQVVRADAADGDEPWAVAHKIASQLFRLLPEDSLEATRLSAGVLNHVIDELRELSGETSTSSFPGRSLLLRELRDYVLALSRKHRLVIVVDDADGIDEASSAWLAAIAAKSERQRVLIVLAMEPERAGEATSLHVLRSFAQRVSLPALDAEQTEALLRSVFGDAPNVGLIAGAIHTLAHGSPLTTMELCQHLVVRGLARYEAGSWLLPQQLAASDMPATLAESLARRVRELSADARELAEALCIADVALFPPTAYRDFTQHGDPRRVFLALEELVTARVLVTGGEHYRFSQRGFVPVLLAGMSAARQARQHGRLADLFAETGGDVLRRAQHLMAAGREAEAVELLCSMDLQARLPPLELLERAVEHAERSRALPARALHRLQMALLAKASLLLENGVFKRFLPNVLAHLERDSGLAMYRELGEVPEAQRLTQALSTQQQRYLATPEHEQVYPVGDAIRELARLTGISCSIAGTAFDLGVLAALPALDPLLPLSPALRITSQLKLATWLWMTGRADRAEQIFEAALARISQSDRAGLDEAQHERTQLLVQYSMALYEATRGIQHAEQRAQFLESSRALRVHAWRVRSLMHVHQGDANASRKAAHRAELLQLQDESETYYPGTGAGLYQSAYLLAGDLLGMKRALDTQARFAERNPGWRPMLAYGDGCYRYLSGDLAGALDRVLAGLGLARPGENLTWGFLAALHIQVLRELGRLDEALEHAQQYSELAQREELTIAQRFILLESALTSAAGGQYAQALAIIEPLTAFVEARGSRGLALGVFFEARARIAIAMRDPSGFARWAERCAVEYDCQNPALSAKFARLMDEARQAEVAQPEAAAFEKSLRDTQLTAADDEDNAIVSRILECVDASDRARCALTMLLQSADCYLGHLYGVKGGRLGALAGVPQRDAEPALEDWLARWFAAEREHAAAAAALETVGETQQLVSHIQSMDPETQTLDDSGSGASDYIDADGRRFYAVLIDDERSGQRNVAALLVLQAEPGARRPPARLLHKIAKLLIDQGDVQGVPLAGQPR